MSQTRFHQYDENGDTPSERARAQKLFSRHVGKEWTHTMYVVLTHVIGFSTLMIVYWQTLLRGSTTSYTASPLWLDLPFINHIVVLQAVSVVCLFAWAGVVQQRPVRPLVYGASIGYYAVSMVWPVLAKRFLDRPTRVRALVASSPLWTAGACVLLLLHSSTRVPERLLLVPVVVLTVVCDAILWTLAALRRSRR